jgi:alkanesulfonate monooxygenase SsuD/methylene tetrahydromethanopterin reductase-like flavin-dependent oxidoreductase (luciferase family)
VTHQGRAYRYERLRHAPRPVQERLPIMIGGSGERKTLRTVARYADMWNAFGTPDELRHKDEVLRRHCEEVGRNESEIERTVATRMVLRGDRGEARRAYEQLLSANRTSLEQDRAKPWVGTPEEIAERIRGYQQIGFNTLIPELPAPYDVETIERLIGEVKPMVARAPAPAAG